MAPIHSCCIVCGKPFSARKPAFYCARACRQKAHRLRKKKNCASKAVADPGNVFVVSVSQLLDFCGTAGGLTEWDENNPRAVADALAKAIDIAMICLGE